MRVKNSLIPLQRRIFIDLDHGETVKIRVSGKVYGFKTQAENSGRLFETHQKVTEKSRICGKKPGLKEIWLKKTGNTEV